jgi:hypothetical protein
MPTSATLYNEENRLHLAKFSNLTESNARQLLESLRWPQGPYARIVARSTMLGS